MNLPSVKIGSLAPVAQWIERNVADVEAGGSSPLGGAIYGGVPEWFNGQVSKTLGEFLPRRFESSSLRQTSQLAILWKIFERESPRLSNQLVLGISLKGR